MIVKDLALKKITASALIHRLCEEGWTREHDGLPLEVVHRLAAKLDAVAYIDSCEENHLIFTLHTTNIRLRSLYEIPCLLLGGSDDASDAINIFWKRYNTPGFLPLVLTSSAATFDHAVSFLSKGRCLILAAEQIRDLLNAPDSNQLFKRYIWEQVPKRSLIPYSISKPAEGGMFFGRTEELSRLEEEDDSSFAIAGPGRIGKTSLVKRYERQMQYTHNQRAIRFEVSFYKSEPTADAQARFFAMEISPSSRSDRMVASGLVDFMRYMRYRNEKPIELLLDEVDEVCQGDVLRYLGEATKMGLCRLILSGKGNLLKMMLNTTSPLDCRLELMQLGPLNDNSASALLLAPLTDLGFQIEKADQLLDHVLKLTGRLPHLLQLFGKKLAEYAIREDTKVINPELLEKTKGDFLIPHFFVKSLNDLTDPETRLIGLLLVSETSDTVSSVDIGKLGERQGLFLDSKRINDICIDLVINNVLIWNNGSYRLANEGLPLYARQTKYLTNALREAQAAVPTTN